MVARGLRSRALWAAVLLAMCLSVTRSLAEADQNLDWVQLSLGAGAGYGHYDKTLLTDDCLALEGRVGLTFFRVLGLEATYGKGYGNSPRVPDHNFPLDHLAADVIVTPLPDARIRPFLRAGWAELDLDTTTQTPLALNGWEFGAGFKYPLMQTIEYDMDLRIEARTVLVKNDPPLADVGDTKSSWILTAGIQIDLPGKYRDSDLDGVSDRWDECPGTRWPTPVDKHGCPLDSDGDGVLDENDICPGTPAGATVDERGCPHDSDMDGVLDGLDRCPGTRRGVPVDPSGCP